jgi:UPF0176 protein
VGEKYLNLSGYRFVALPDAHAWRERIHEAALGAGLRGTVLLAEEGINAFVAGPADALQRWLQWLRDADPRFAPLEVKQSWSEAWPFRRLRVKVKREIIRMNRPQVRPEAGRAPAVDAATLARWLDAGRDIVLLDTRNAFEVEQGAFDGALDWRLNKFSDFPTALAERRADLDGRTVVTYCTGGIRCEKAALALREAGMADVWQLDGGILRYLEAVPGARHWHGRCFVFDERGSLDAELAPANP